MGPWPEKEIRFSRHSGFIRLRGSPGKPGDTGKEQSESGFALVAAIMIGLTILTLAAAWFAAMTTGARRARLEQDRLQARYTALAGIAKFTRALETAGGPTRPGPAQPIDLYQPRKWDERVFADGEACDMESSLAYGFAVVSSTGKSRGARHSEKLRLGIEPDSLFPWALASADPRGLILEPGSRVDGDISSMAAPQNWGGSWNGSHRPLAAFPELQTGSFDQALAFFHDVASNPAKADLELFSPQVFGPDRPVPRGRIIFVNDNVLLESRSPEDGYREDGPKVLVSTADVQVSGWAKVSGLTILALGRITLAGQVWLSDCILYSPQEIAMTDEARFQGLAFSLMDISLSGRAAAGRSSLLYSASNPSGRIWLSEESAVSGAVIFAGGSASGSGVFLDPGATVNGFVFSAGNASLEGTVNGAVAAAKLFKAGADTLQNNKLGGIIRRAGMPRMSLPLCFKVEPKRGWFVPDRTFSVME